MASSAPVVRAFGAPLRRVRLPLGMKPLEAVTSDTATIDALVGETQVGDTMKRVWRPPAETAIKVLQRECALPQRMTAILLTHSVLASPLCRQL